MDESEREWLPCDDPSHGPAVLLPEPHHNPGKWGPWRVMENNTTWEYRSRRCSRCSQAFEESRPRKNPPPSVKALEAEIARRAKINRETGATP